MKEEQHFFKESIESIPIPDQKLDSIIQETIQSTEPKMKKTKKRGILYGVSVAVVACGVLIGSSSVSPAVASVVSQIPIIGAFVKTGDDGLKNVSEQGLSDVIGESITSNGKTLTIEEAFYDGTRLSIGYSLTSDVPLSEHDNPGVSNIEVNGKPLNGYATSGSGKLVNETTFSGFYDFDGLNETLPDSLTLGIDFYGTDDENWNFNFPISNKHDVRDLVINQSQQVDGVEVKLLQLKMGSGGTTLDYEITVDKNNQDFDPMLLEFKVKDNLNNSLSDNAGAGSMSSSSEGNKLVYTGSTRINPVSEKASKLVITPQFFKGEYFEVVEESDKMGEVIVDIEPSEEMRISPDSIIQFDSFHIELN